MKTHRGILGIAFISLLWFSCKDGPKFDKHPKSAPTKEAKPAEEDSEDAEAAQQQALEPIAIGGAYLTCLYQVVESNSEVWCRLEDNQQPVHVDTVSTLENWVFMQNDVPYDATPFALDPATGWQWGIKIPQDTDVDVSLDVFLDGVRYHFSTTITTKPEEDDSSDDDIKPASPAALVNRYAYGNTASFVVDNNPFSLSAPDGCFPSTKVPDPTLPDLRFFLKAQKFTFPFKVTKDGSITTITVDEICGQTRPIHFAELRGPAYASKVEIPVGSKKVVVIKSTTLIAGDYVLEVHFVPRSILDLQAPEKFAFGKVVLESSDLLIPGRAFGN